MSTLSQLALACNSIVLKEVLAVMFENDNEHDFNLVMHTKLNDLGIRIRQRAKLILYVEKQGYSPEVFETVKLLKGLQETDNAKARFGYFNLSNATIFGGIGTPKSYQGDWLGRGNNCLKDLIIDSQVNLDLTLTISEQQTIWYMAFRKFYMLYIPRAPPTTYTDIFDDYMKKLSSSRKQRKIDTRDLPIIRRCDTTSVEEIRLKDGVIAKLNSQVLGRERKGVSLEYLLQEESRLKQEEEERFRLEEHKIIEALLLKLCKGVQRREEKKRCSS
ncbi:hypothetical protein Tco_1198708 [Tanacetum coccineum]